MKNKLLYICLIIVLIVSIIIAIFAIKGNNNNFKKVNLMSGDTEQTKDYKLYEFGIDDNELCEEMEDIVSEVVSEYKEYIDFEYIDVTKNMSISNIYNINAIPTFLIVDSSGNVKVRKSGIMNKSELIEFINNIKDNENL